MLSNAAAVTDANIAALTTAKTNGTCNYLLGFNEPDNAGQANMTVAQALSLWPKLMQTGLTLGSPAPTWTNAWIDSFMTKAAAGNLRVDFLCLHFYRSPADTGSVSELSRFLTAAYNKYKKPIWLTEFGAPDCNSLGWCGSAPALTQPVTDAYTKKVIAMLEDLACVQRYAWFVDASQSGFELSAVFNNDGTLTQTGIDLRDAHGTAAVRPTVQAAPRAAANGSVHLRADGRIAFVLPSCQTPYRLSFYSAAGRLVAMRNGTGAGTIALDRDAVKLTSGIYSARLEYGGSTKAATIVAE
jgi:hypothetical protein